jgi:uncharacterized Zn finger protein
MTYKVTFSSGNNYSAKLSQPTNYKTTLGFNVEIMAQNLDELSDVEISGNNDKYVLMYDAATGKWKDRNPDEVLNAAASTETTQPGLVGYATAFLDRVDIDLDDRINLDAGGF